MKNLLKLGALAIASGLILSSCNSESSNDESIDVENVGDIMSNAVQGEEVHIGEENAEKPLPKNSVIIKQMKYIPETITVKRGDTITFINQDMVPHDVTQSDSSWQSPYLEVGDVWQFVPQESDHYFCSIHLVMNGNIVVEE